MLPLFSPQYLFQTPKTTPIVYISVYQFGLNRDHLASPKDPNTLGHIFFLWQLERARQIFF
ncbi:MAG: hypothetical protein COZ28_00110 [Candidatus Moranbacteria bacterium CG_4_10_14_3_um_filter_44_15]|nr:MAG: hypothetical protein COZ28_00110 [Candidatus Moranbacteria bacterium CG_4_10_14_3_um_filter_44_15]